MLVPKLCEEKILELLQRAIDMTRNRYRLCLVSRGIDFDKVFKFVVIDIV